MKTSRANSTSFRLHHIGKASSTRKSSQTFYNPDESFKLAALNSVSRGVKHADLSFMTGTNLNKLRVEPLENNDGQYHSAHDNLTEVRARYDEIKKQRVQLQRRIDGIKEEIGKFTIFKTEYEDRIGEAKSKAAALKAKLEEKKSLLQETIIEKKVVANMEWRHKTDRVFYDQCKYNSEKELEYRRKQLAIFRKEGIENLESDDRTMKIYEKLGQQIERERLERQEHIRNLEAMIQEKLQLQNVNSQREAELVEIAERAVQDKDQNEKQWRKIFLTHIFVNKMLRNKIEKEMQKFRTVEFAFKEIKTATGVTDAKTLVTKYLNKEAVYGQLLSKIADNQKTIENLKNETDQLIHESKQLEMEKEVLQNIKIKSQDLHDEVKELDSIGQRATKAENYSHKMNLWVVRQLKKMAALAKPEDDKAVELASGMKKLLGLLEREVDTSGEGVQLIEEARDLSGPRQNQRNTRVMPKKSRKNSMGEQIFDVEEEEASPSTNIEQQEHINYQHEAVLRQNEKFMRELKRRKEQEKKLLIDKKEVKKETKAPQIKREED